jgi:hypothetical protein
MIFHTSSHCAIAVVPENKQNWQMRLQGKE